MSAFVLAPLLVAGFGMATQAGAVKAASQHPFYEMFGKALLTADVWLLFTTPLVLFLAFRFRRQVRVHSALMLSTLVGLMPPMLSRLYAGFMPGMTVRGPDTLYRFEYCLYASMATTVVAALWLYARNRKDGWPWLLAAGITIGCYALFMTLGQTSAWSAAVIPITDTPAWVAAKAGLVLGLAACLAGWYGTGTRRGALVEQPGAG
ncbi:MAG: hypothetical protein AAGE01_22140 [Pseudomonadota bacterium]